MRYEIFSRNIVSICLFNSGLHDHGILQKILSSRFENLSFSIHRFEVKPGKPVCGISMRRTYSI